MREGLTVTRATARHSVCVVFMCVCVCVCVCVCRGVYLAGDLEVLRVEDREALRELQQLPWRCELLPGVSPGDLAEGQRTDGRTRSHTHAHVITQRATCMYAYTTGDTHATASSVLDLTICKTVHAPPNTFNIYSNQDGVRCMARKMCWTHWFTVINILGESGSPR